MGEPLTVFVLAAGLGERLRPITYHFPKPLLPVVGKPLLQRILEKVACLSRQSIGINLHYKRDVIQEWIDHSAFRERVLTFPEDPILGTGGALKNAESFLSGNTFLVHNSDIVSDIDLDALVEAHRSSGNLVTLAVHDFPRFNTLLIDERGSLKDLVTSSATPTERGRLRAFTGIAVYEPSFLKFLPVGISSVVDVWLSAVRSGFTIGTAEVNGCYWSDIGTPPAYASSVIDAMKSDGETVYVHPTVKGCSHADMDGYVIIEEGCTVEPGSRLVNSVILPGTTVTEGSSYQTCILGPDFRIPLKESEMLGVSEIGNTIPIGTGGSDRQYYRIRKGESSVVFLQTTEEDPDFQRQIEYTRFFLRHGGSVPRVMQVDFEKRQAYFEDLGDCSLYSWLKCERPREDCEALYERVLDCVVPLHTRVTDNVSECPLLAARIFDYAHLRWETGYFIERFVEGLMNLKLHNASALEVEFHRLASLVDSFPKTVVHRDFQSQNLMVTKGGAPRIIDYQGARIGPPAYDIASLLWDPYYRLEDELRDRLLSYYVDRVKAVRGDDFSEKDFRRTLIPCRLQRHMQALGAYGFLSLVKGRRHFLKYVKEGLRLLREDVELTRGEYPFLADLVGRLTMD